MNDTVIRLIQVKLFVLCISLIMAVIRSSLVALCFTGVYIRKCFLLIFLRTHKIMYHLRIWCLEDRPVNRVKKGDCRTDVYPLSTETRTFERRRYRCKKTNELSNVVLDKTGKERVNEVRKHFQASLKVSYISRPSGTDEKKLTWQLGNDMLVKRIYNFSLFCSFSFII